MWGRKRKQPPVENEGAAASTVDVSPVDVASTVDAGSTVDPAVTAAEAEEFARPLVHGGFSTPEDIAVAITEYFDPDEQPVSLDEARAIVDRLWRERLAEQRSWPAVTDADRVLAAFSALSGSGVVARPDFTCCQNCGVTEIGAEAAPGDRGFVFFHQQDTARITEGGELMLSFGPFSGSGTATAQVGQTVVAALRAQDLSVTWDGSPDERIRVAVDWQKRLS
ncbi:hypothetical protein VSH64_26095 [Amycolatopsis rhabdoformis]|uniref:DUF6891 domain-containing protein n=1 Tax=Amycolatopsis rhabdoformis TaxID=1448059 RepID=A0ABZ1HXV5_9PSEU|nr:hypothetical protein [Amycolatopsis rhabdoformis]WSE26351.1 hypothetical protein VSH64_26095 [Amycolatopsis rhabdoformis]